MSDLFTHIEELQEVTFIHANHAEKLLRLIKRELEGKPLIEIEADIRSSDGYTYIRFDDGYGENVGLELRYMIKEHNFCIYLHEEDGTSTFKYTLHDDEDGLLELIPQKILSLMQNYA